MKKLDTLEQLTTPISDQEAEMLSGGSNWGQLTQFAIVEEDFNQGEHAASFAGVRRQGLGNLNKDLAEAGYGEKQGLDALTNFVAAGFSS